MKYRVFTYGTLMTNERNHGCIKDGIYIKDAVLIDYCLYETPYNYPAAKYKKGFRVYGQIYEVDDNTKKILDDLEQVGVLYSCNKGIVVSEDGEEEVYFYEYLKDTSAMPIRLPYGKWTSVKRNIDDYVWYAVYGSIILDELFDEYIENTVSKEKPVDGKIYNFKHPIYFATSSDKWNGGMAFLDIEKEGFAYGYRYLINKKQYEQILRDKGKYYDYDILIDHDELGIEIRTITHNTRYEETIPSMKYLEIVSAGLIQRGIIDDIKKANEYFGVDDDIDVSENHIREIIDSIK